MRARSRTGSGEARGHGHHEVAPRNVAGLVIVLGIFCFVRHCKISSVTKYIVFHLNGCELELIQRCVKRLKKLLSFQCGRSAASATRSPTSSRMRLNSAAAGLSTGWLRSSEGA